ncbi:lysophospholipid acyltransferase family protein [Neptunomonas sp.]|uniref:lysophospholipid acyltransferase family protein n=1 Tax=Neptunomonas sp. TaxID=1971898 RepID=UPI0025F506BC|nr:lysophospholipid acyltransferase family protein [Neptunomonas sp.]
MINIEQALVQKYPAFSAKPATLRRSAIYCLRRLIHEDEINSFLTKNTEARGFEFVDKVLDYFDFSYSLSHVDRMNIPSSGRVVIIANHPLGALDGLALLKLIGEVRRDVRIVANDVLSHFEQLSSLFLPVDNLGNGTKKKDIERIIHSLQNEEAVIVFPAGEVSRAGMTGIKDGKWNSGFLRFARKANAPVLPVYLGGKNSPLFYGVSYIHKSLSSLLLAREMFNKQSTIIPIRIGQAIPYSHIDAVPISTTEKSKLVRKHLYRIAKRKSPLFNTEKTIVHPQDRRLLKQELKASELLGETVDGKKIYLFDHCPDSAVMQEIGRLREISFRCVGEGTGKNKDLDKYDHYYRHIILWDEDDLEIAGAYRLAEAHKLIHDSNSPLYSETLFQYGEAMHPYFEQGIELGRSFVQPRYWGRRSLDYLWYGIGAYLKKHPNVRYLFGPVSLSNRYPKPAKDMLVWFYQHYFADNNRLAKAHTPYELSSKESVLTVFIGDDYQTDFKILKEQLNYLGVSVPTLYKQYSELCTTGGVRFMDFGIDANFNYCVDGLVMVDTHFIKEKKHQRYVGNKLP